MQGALSSRSPRVVEEGRTYSYVLWESGGQRVAITQNDVRAIQLAKAVLRAGIDLLVEHAGGPEVTDIRLAGAFGAHIDPLHAMVLGLVPDCPLDGVRAVGNAAGTGAVQALLSRELRGEMERGGARRREDRDGDRATLPGALRRSDGVPPRDRIHQPSRRSRRVAGEGRAGRPIRWWGRSRAPPSPPGGRGMTNDTEPRRRSGGRGGRQALRASRRRGARTVPHPHHEAVRAGVRRRARAARAQRRHDPRRGRGRDPRLPVGGRALPRRRRRHRGHPGAVPAWHVPPDRPGDRTRGVHPARPQPGAQRADRWRRHGVRPQLRLALRARPRRRPPLRDHRRLRELREAQLLVAVPAPLGRHGVRARRRARQQAPPRHGVRPPALERQAVHGIGHRGTARRRLGRAGAHRVRW